MPPGLHPAAQAQKTGFFSKSTLEKGHSSPIYTCIASASGTASRVQAIDSD